MATKPLNQPTILAKRLREAREEMGLPQDKLGVLIGLDEGCSSARISRYESGVHHPPLKTLEMMAKALKVPLPYLFCEDDQLATAILFLSRLGKRRFAEEVKRLEEI